MKKIALRKANHKMGPWIKTGTSTILPQDGLPFTPLKTPI
jgi:hypothetical protein